MDPVQLLHVVVKQVGKVYLDLLGHKLRQIFTLRCQYTCMYSKAATVRATCLSHLFIHFAKSLDPDQALHLRPDQDPNCLTLWWYF